MTAKEQAVKLVLRYKPFVYCYMGSGMLSNTYDEDVALNMAKQCALIAVETVLESNPTLINCDGSELNYAYWIDVKKEIENL